MRIEDPSGSVAGSECAMHLDFQLVASIREGVENACAFATTYSGQTKYSGIQEIPLIAIDYVEGHAVAEKYENCQDPHRILEEVLTENYMCQDGGVGGTYHNGEEGRYMTITTFPSQINPRLGFKRIRYVEEIGSKEDPSHMIHREVWSVIGTQRYGPEPIIGRIRRMFSR